MRSIIYSLLMILLIAISPATYNLTETRQIGENSLETNGVLSLPTTTVYDHYADDQIVEHGSTLETADSNSTHPITKDEFQFIDLEEFVVIPYLPENNATVYEDAGGDFNQTYSIPETLNRYGDKDVSFLKGYYYDLALGDIDGDGYDEIIIVDLDYFIIIDDAAHNYTLLGKYDVPVVANGARYASIATGDVDGNGIDEILYASYAYGWYVEGMGLSCPLKLSIYSFLPTWTLLLSRIVKDGYVLTGAERFGGEPEIATGDFDGDGRDEIAIAFTFDHSYPTYDDIWILDDYQNDFVQIWSSPIFTYLSDNDYSPTMDIDIATGDFDGDGLDEIAYSAAVLKDGYHAQLAIIDNDFTVDLLDIIGSPPDSYVYKTPVATGDLDGDGLDEIVMGTAYGGSTSYSGDLHIYEYLPEDDSYELNTSVAASFLDTFLDVGDVDCDGLDEIVGSGRYHTGVIDDAKHSYVVMGSNTDVGGVVRIGDLDGDGVRLKYTGESWNNTPPPGIVAVIAAPPVYDGIDQNYISSYTAFGQETSIGSGVGSEIGTIVSTTYSFEQTLDWKVIELLRASYARIVATEFIRTNTKIHTEIKTVSHATGWTDDAVVFHVTSYTSYKYQIIHHPYNSSLVGSHITIDVPDEPLMNAWTVPYFNSVYGELLSLNHTIGQPWTYPSRAEANVIAPTRWQAGEQIVGQGSGFTTTTIEIAEQTTSGMEMVISSETDAGGAIAGFGYDQSTGTRDSSIYEIIIGESAIFEGCVGFIANEEMWEELNYIYNLIAYNQHTPDGRNYLVINYYVEGASVFVPTTGETTSSETTTGESSEGVISTGTGVMGFLMIITSIRVVKRKRN